MVYYVVTERQKTRELLEECKRRLTKVKSRRLDDVRNITEIESGLWDRIAITRKFGMKKTAKMFAAGL